MLALDDPRWATLQHAYGNAGDIPAMLRELEDPASSTETEPWFSLWSALAHQGDVYTASFAAVPHVVRVFGLDPARADMNFLHFPAWVEICRQRKAVEIPHDLSPPYFAALARLPSLVAAAAVREWSAEDLACALGAVAAAKGAAVVAEAVLELNADVAKEFLRWHLG